MSRKGKRIITRRQELIEITSTSYDMSSIEKADNISKDNYSRYNENKEEFGLLPNHLYINSVVV
ncbi:hypothetical protein J2Z48_002143 [Croceifilum oryzae]|uniref:Uncharacterized protein n=1 Tax=Croceifilum oryzae TaxID=1553429 RepID=A0AAJ1TG95_9BACL|nr:hypothetical protein [Croceifilum oryzae]